MKIMWFHVDINSRRLECGLIQRDGEDKSLGCTLFCGVNDFWQLCPLQPSCCYFGRRLLFGGKLLVKFDF